MSSSNIFNMCTLGRCSKGSSNLLKIYATEASGEVGPG